jgi:inorganic pyrophosphatase
MPPQPVELAHDLDSNTLTCRAIVETPCGSTAKFVFDEGSGLFTLGKLLPLGLSFPFDFGFIPSTCGGDGDPLDVILLNECPLPVGCVIPVRLLGLIAVEQWREGEAKVRNDRLVARLADSRLFSQVRSLSDLADGTVDRWNAFFEHYKSARGQKVTVLGVHGPETAADMIASSTR